MFKILKKNNSDPYKKFYKAYSTAIEKNQNAIDAMAISSFDAPNNQVDSRFVNLKYIVDDEWVFFSNYHSPKAKQFSQNNKVAILFLWTSINLQIRIKAKIKKSSDLMSDEHFTNRSMKKNILAISSDQSQEIKSYEDVKQKFQKTFSSKIDFKKRPDYWGGFSFTPYYFEFWEGREHRLNLRESFILKDSKWKKNILQP